MSPLDEAVARLKAGDVVAFPTETVYGLGADARNPRAVQRVFDLKGRPASNPLIVHVSSAAMARRVVRNWPPEATRLAEAFWPGSLTIVLPKADAIPPVVTAGGDTVGVRCPDHALALALIEQFGAPIVGPSANRSGSVSPTTAEHVRAEFGSAVFVLDGGACRAGIESTVLTLSPRPRVLRPGIISAAAIGAVLGCQVDVQPRGANADAPQPSPGLLARHYAPRSPARLFSAQQLPSILAGAGGNVCILARSSFSITHPACTIIAMPMDASAYAAALYGALRRADAMHPSLIAIERVPPAGGDDDETALWHAIADRLTRATTPNAP